jgi:hypothetical protein
MADVSHSYDQTPVAEIEQVTRMFHKGATIRVFVIGGKYWYAAVDIGKVLGIGRNGPEVRRYLETGFMTVNLTGFAEANPGLVDLAQTKNGLLVLVNDPAVDTLTRYGMQMGRCVEKEGWYMMAKEEPQQQVIQTAAKPLSQTPVTELIEQEETTEEILKAFEQAEKVHVTIRPKPRPPRKDTRMPNSPISIRPERISPDQARRYLAANTSNRNIRRELVKVYARDMAEGRWKDNGETIKFSKDGVLIDGQHRLEAVVQANVTISMVVVRGLNADVQATIDAGAKRTAGDALKLRGEMYGRTLAAVARRCLIWEASDRKDMDPSHRSVSHQEVIDYVAAHPDLQNATDFAQHITGSRPAPLSVMGFSYWALAQISQDDADLFFEGLTTGVNLTPGNPVLALRNRLLDVRYRRYSAQDDREKVALIFKGWNFFRAGRPVQILKFMKSESFPIPK